MLKVFHAAGLDRRSYVVVIGGGAVLDAVGFAAAIAHRGIRLVRLPTTTLAQADSGVGVKNAVNLFGKKNWIGSFAVPWAVLNDTSLLATLPDRDFIAGFSEAVKVSLLKDPAFFDTICRDAPLIRRRDMAATLPVIRASAEWHRDHITKGGDPFEAQRSAAAGLRPLVGPLPGGPGRTARPPRRGRRHRRGDRHPSHSSLAHGLAGRGRRPRPSAAWSTSASPWTTRILSRDPSALFEGLE